MTSGWSGWQRISLAVLMAVALWFLWLMSVKNQTRAGATSIRNEPGGIPAWNGAAKALR